MLLHQSSKTLKGNNSKDIGNLRKLIKDHKVENIKNMFISKISRNSIYRNPVVYEPFTTQKASVTGVTLPKLAVNIFMILSILNTVIACLLATLSLVFTEI